MHCVRVLLQLAIIAFQRWLPVVDNNIHNMFAMINTQGSIPLCMMSSLLEITQCILTGPTSPVLPVRFWPDHFYVIGCACDDDQGVECGIVETVSCRIGAAGTVLKDNSQRCHLPAFSNFDLCIYLTMWARQEPILFARLHQKHSQNVLNFPGGTSPRPP